jgi:signal transduction histidine kinase/HAMP domain-containing protein
MRGIEDIATDLSDRSHRVLDRWLGGIGCRVAFFMSAALVLVAVLLGAFYFWSGRKAMDQEIRTKALYLAKHLAALTIDDIITGNRYEIYKKIAPAFIANQDASSGSDLLYMMVYKHTCELLIGSSATQVYFNSDTYFYTIPSHNDTVQEEVPLGCEASQATGPVFTIKTTGVYDLIFPVMSGSQKAGYVRIGLSGQRFAEHFSAIMKKALFALVVILLIGVTFSQIIALGITRPVLQLGDAVEKLSRQNWDSPLPVKGRDEISKLSQAFNQMASTLKQREMSLSRGNKDLFLLHTAGLDLMESLDLRTLLGKIAARAEDLVRADTIAVTTVNPAAGMLTTLGIFGSKAHQLEGMELPLEAGGIYNWLACYGAPLLIADAQADFRLENSLMKSFGITSLMTIPLWSANSMTGLLTAVNKKGGARFDKQDLRLFTVFSNMAGAALQNASLYTDLRENMNELRNAQEQLVHSTKMAAIGELAANVAHEVNNPLTSVLGYTTHLLKTLQLPESEKRILSMMEQETLRVRRIIRNLLDFSRQKASRMQPADLLVPLRETTAFVRGAAEASSVTIREEFNSVPVIVNMDPNEMKQVFINIINNAMHAMPKGGHLLTRVRHINEHEVAIDFADTGVGISKENLNKIFQPFFSTKETGDGTGLGLSISYRIVQNHGGRIEVESTPGQGTVFTVVLPLHKQPVLLQRR